MTIPLYPYTLLTLIAFQSFQSLRFLPLYPYTLLTLLHVADPPGGFFGKRTTCKTKHVTFFNCLLSHSDTGFRFYVKDWLDRYQGHVLERFLRRAVARQR